MQTAVQKEQTVQRLDSQAKLKIIAANSPNIDSDLDFFFRNIPQIYKDSDEQQRKKARRY